MEFRIVFFVLVFTFILLEIFWAKRKGKKVYNLKEVFANGGIFLVNQLTKPLKVVWIFIVFSWVETLAIFKLEVNWLTTILAIILVDFAYYWHHRLLHEVKALWTLHHVHHSSPWMNLTTAFRINWLDFVVMPVFYFPVLLIGFSVEQTAVFFAINLIYQFFLHTESVKKVPFLEGWLNTPSAHRVHHGSNPIYIDKNYGGVLMIWDRLFGTYQAEVEPVKYGVTTGFKGHNPIKLVLQPIWEYVQGKFRREKELEV